MSNRPVRDDDDLEDSTEGDDEIRRYEEAKERELKRQEYAKANYALTAPSMDDLFVGYDSETVRLLSRAYRESHEYTSIGLTYGEIIYKEFHDMFTKIYKHGFQYQSGGFYVDIGAGSGKALFAGHLIHNFSRCLGIEILKPLQDVSNKVLTKWEKVIARRHPDWRESDIRFLCGDIKYIHSWTNADVVFAHFTCMEEDIKQHLAEKATAMRPGTFFITTTFSLPKESLFDVVETTSMLCSWGKATVYIHRRSETMLSGTSSDPRGYMEKLMKQWADK